MQVRVTKFQTSYHHATLPIFFDVVKYVRATCAPYLYCKKAARGANSPLTVTVLLSKELKKGMVKVTIMQGRQRTKGQTGGSSIFHSNCEIPHVVQWTFLPFLQHTTTRKETGHSL